MSEEDTTHSLMVALDARLEGRGDDTILPLIEQAIVDADSDDKVRAIGMAYRELLRTAEVKATRADRRVIAIALLRRALRKERGE